ncbi:MAG TPA: response regulator transcription factor [Caulobacteraceae bacterium]|jgi:DNA-binding NarL/FixJ family response regulator
MDRHIHPAAAPDGLRLLLVCRVRLYSKALCDLLQAESGVAAVEAASPEDDIVGAVDAAAPDVTLVDPGQAGMLALVAELVRMRPKVRMLGFGIDDAPAAVAACATAGLWGYVPNTASIAELVAAAREVALGRIVCPAAMAGGLFRHLRDTSLGAAADLGVELTQRQRQIMQLVGDGLSNKEIAGRLSLGLSTVKNHVHEILGRLHVTSRSAAAAQLRR